jgi:hypothetical protein
MKLNEFNAQARQSLRKAIWADYYRSEEAFRTAPEGSELQRVAYKAMNDAQAILAEDAVNQG